MSDFTLGALSAEFQGLVKMLESADEAALTGPVSKPSVTPASIGPKDLLDVKVPEPKKAKDPNVIWEDDEVTDCVEEWVDDGREVPSYEFVYKQAVESTDVFLGMSGKDPSSTQCEEIVARIELPKAASAAELDLEVKPTYLKLNSPIYKLSIYLPHKVNSEKGKARWDAAKKVLAVSLPIIRDEDWMI